MFGVPRSGLAMPWRTCRRAEILTILINPIISEWLNFITRWVHVFAGIMWVGTTYYFTWLDARLSEEEKAVANTGKGAQIWMVHSGGFYVVEKRKVPDLVSRTLHWFR